MRRTSVTKVSGNRVFQQTVRRRCSSAAEDQLGQGIAMDLQASIRTSGDITILDLQGRATLGVGNDLLSSHLRKLIDGGSRKLLLNLTDRSEEHTSELQSRLHL